MRERRLNQSQLKLLEELIGGRGPAGEEGEVAEICERELQRTTDEIWRDAMGNVISVIRATGATARDGAVSLMAHMDEIALIVKRVTATGEIRIIKLGGLLPMSFGQCPVDIMGDHAIVPGVMSIGSLHVTKETASLNQRSDDHLDWDDMFITTRLNSEQLAAKGVHAGSRVVLGHYMRRLFEFEDCVAGHFMDDRALLLTGIETMRLLAEQRHRLSRDVYFICTVNEEVSNAGGYYAAKHIPGDEVIALEVGPVAAEYDTCLNQHPIILYGDMKGFYSKVLCDRLKGAAEAEDLRPQLALFENFATDASAILSHGDAAQAATLCLPTQNTHGFEIIHQEAVNAATQTLGHYLLSA